MYGCILKTCIFGYFVLQFHSRNMFLSKGKRQRYLSGLSLFWEYLIVWASWINYFRTKREASILVLTVSINSCTAVGIHSKLTIYTVGSYNLGCGACGLIFFFTIFSIDHTLPLVKVKLQTLPFLGGVAYLRANNTKPLQ